MLYQHRFNFTSQKSLTKSVSLNLVLALSTGGYWDSNAVCISYCRHEAQLSEKGSHNLPLTTAMINFVHVGYRGIIYVPLTYFKKRSCIYSMTTALRLAANIIN